MCKTDFRTGHSTYSRRNTQSSKRHTIYANARNLNPGKRLLLDACNLRSFSFHNAWRCGSQKTLTAGMIFTNLVTWWRACDDIFACRPDPKALANWLTAHGSTLCKVWYPLERLFGGHSICFQHKLESSCFNSCIRKRSCAWKKWNVRNNYVSGKDFLHPKRENCYTLTPRYWR